MIGNPFEDLRHSAALESWALLEEVLKGFNSWTGSSPQTSAVYHPHPLPTVRKSEDNRYKKFPLSRDLNVSGTLKMKNPLRLKVMQ